jgi:hypothetical protein
MASEISVGRERVARDTVVEPVATAARFRDEVRWGPIVAGFVTAITSFILLTLLAAWAGLIFRAVAPGSQQSVVNTASGWATAIIGLVAFFVGGWVAGVSLSVTRSWSGILNGFLVWAAGLVFMLIMAGLGLGSLFGTLGTLFGNVQSLNTPNVDQQTVLSSIQSGAGVAFIALALGALAAAFGGWVGALTLRGTRDTTPTS